MAEEISMEVLDNDSMAEADHLMVWQRSWTYMTRNFAFQGNVVYSDPAFTSGYTPDNYTLGFNAFTPGYTICIVIQKMNAQKLGTRKTKLQAK